MWRGGCHVMKEHVWDGGRKRGFFHRGAAAVENRLKRSQLDFSLLNTEAIVKGVSTQSKLLLTDIITQEHFRCKMKFFLFFSELGPMVSRDDVCPFLLFISEEHLGWRTSRWCHKVRHVRKMFDRSFKSNFKLTYKVSNTFSVTNLVSSVPSGLKEFGWDCW